MALPIYLVLLSVCLLLLITICAMQGNSTQDLSMIAELHRLRATNEQLHLRLRELSMAHTEQQLISPSTLGADPKSLPHCSSSRIHHMEDLASLYTNSSSCGEHASLLRRLYVVERTVANSKIPFEMRQRLEASGRDVRLFERQVVISVSSRVLLGQSLAFNRVRSQRVGSSDLCNCREGLAVELRRLPCHLPTSSDFCNPANRTMVDERVGYLTSIEAVGFANMGRLTALHGVIATRQFVDPALLNADDMIGMFHLSHQWFTRTNQAYPLEAKYPTLTFDLLRNGGASQTHPHMQPHLVATRYPGKWEDLRNAACEYASRWRRSYFADIASTASYLGLVVHRTEHFVAFFALTSVGSGPQIDIVGEGTEGSAGWEDVSLMHELGRIFHVVLSGAQSALGWDGISASCAFPPMGIAGHSTARLPRMCHLVSRGHYDAVVSDISANELFETPAVSVDLFEVAALVRTAIRRTPQQYQASKRKTAPLNQSGSFQYELRNT